MSQLITSPEADEAATSSALILERALLGAIAAMVPVPFVDDVLLRRARRALLREIATRARLHLDAPSLEVLAADPEVSRLARAGLGLVARALRGAAMPLRVADRARAALVSYQLATLLDHYARVHHRGLDLDVERTRRLRAAFEEVMRITPPQLGALRRPADHGTALRATFDALWTQREQA